MKPEETFFPLASAARAQHNRLHTRLTKLQELVSDTSQNRESQAAQVVAELIILGRQLSAHFAFEEQGGWLEEAACQLPRLSGPILELQSEHHEILASLDRIVNSLQQPVKKEGHWQQSRHEIDDFVDQLLRHEAAEERILQQGFNQDLEITD